MRTLAIDIGGSGLKMMTLGPDGEPVGSRDRCPTPGPATPAAVLAALAAMLPRQPAFDRVAAGFPGVVDGGRTLTAPNLDRAWEGFDFRSALAGLTGKPTRVANDADVQGAAVIQGSGVEFVLTLGTGLGSALYLNRKLVPNLEIAHHVFRKNRTYEEWLGDAALERYGKVRWNKLLLMALEQLRHTFNYRCLYIGGGNARKVKAQLPDNVQIVPNVAGLLGCMWLWEAPSSQFKLRVDDFAGSRAEAPSAQ